MQLRMLLLIAAVAVVVAAVVVVVAVGVGVPPVLWPSVYLYSSKRWQPSPREREIHAQCPSLCPYPPL